MSVIHLLSGTRINGQQFSVGNITYPSNWISCSTTGDQDALGIVRLTEVFPTLISGQKYDGTYTDDLQAHTRTYNISSMSATEIAATNYTTMQTNLATGTGIPDTFIASAAVWNAKQPAGAYLTSISGQDYATLANKPTIPSAQVNTDWTSSSGSSQLLNKPVLATVATTGAYPDLSGRPTIPAAQVNSDWSAVVGVTQILNKPTITSGTVTSVTSADSNATITTTTTTPVITIVSSPKWAISRLLAGNSVDGSGNVAFSNKFIVQGITDTGLSGAQFLGALGTGILKNTTTTGVLSIASSQDFPTLNQNTSGSSASCTGNSLTATTLQTTRTINGVNFNGSADITIPAASGTLTGATLAAGITASSLISFGAAVVLGTPVSGTLINCTGYTTANLPTITLTGNVTGAASAGSIVTTIAAGVVTNTMLAGSIDLTTKVTGALPFASGGTLGAAATSATTGTISVNMTTAVITITPTGACTFSAAVGGVAGQVVTFVITTSGVSSFVLTFGTNFKSTGTLTTGTTTAKMFAVTFRCYTTNLWLEISRTIVQ